jgi:Domain of unknown function (DUF1918)
MNAGAVWDARVGDGVSVESHRLRGSRRTGTILEVLGTPDNPYYRVGWQDGRETVFHPGSDAALHPTDKRRRKRAAARPSIGKQAAPPPQPVSAPATRPLRLRARAGDRLVIKGHYLGAPTRDAEILEVLGEDGRPPFRVRWSDSGREGVLFPGPDAGIEHLSGRRPAPAISAADPNAGR